MIQLKVQLEQQQENLTPLQLNAVCRSYTRLSYMKVSIQLRTNEGVPVNDRMSRLLKTATPIYIVNVPSPLCSQTLDPRGDAIGGLPIH